MPTKKIIKDRHLEMEDRIFHDRGGSFDLDQIYDSPKTKNPSKDFSKTPAFIHAHSGNVTATVGKTAFLKCRVRGIDNEAVSWIRPINNHLLTAGR